MTNLKFKIAYFLDKLLKIETSERKFFLLALIGSFCITFEYAIIRPVSNAFFLSFFKSTDLPYVWLLTVPLSWIVMQVYNYLLPRLGVKKVCFLVCFLIISFSLLSCFFAIGSKYLSFIFYAWKEIYIVLMFQQLWSVINSTLKLKNAKRSYGILFAGGGIGSILGSLIPMFKAVSWGSSYLLLFSMPIYGFFMFNYLNMLKESEKIRKQPLGLEKNLPKEKNIFHSFSLIKKSKLLKVILGLVVFMQMTGCLADFQVNTALQTNLEGVDLRAATLAKAMSIVAVCTIVLQILGPVLLIKFFGLKYGHLCIPLSLACCTLPALIHQDFSNILFSFVAIKSCDFSVFNIMKEMLYLPLKEDEKFRAKAFIDVFAYRATKGLASILLFFFPLLFSSSLAFSIYLCMILIFMIWAILIIKGLDNKI
ncbi:MAG: Npt1/Npt2 family nucleotide transporter [Rhabdochlamydiaceae bacterium]